MSRTVVFINTSPTNANLERNSVIHLDATGPEEAVSRAKDLCQGKQIIDLILTFPMAVRASESGFLSSFRGEAELWQEPRTPSVLEFNHGQFMHAQGDPVAYLVKELKDKPTSNRACVTLTSNDQIFTSGDGVLPSFLFLQAGYDGLTRDRLHMTAYFRALEVSDFLPVNIVELALVSDKIATRIPAIRNIDVTIHAFRAHSDPGNTIHHKSRIDSAHPDEIHRWVSSSDGTMIATMLEEKAKPASLVDDSGLVRLSAEMGTANWGFEIRSQLNTAIASLARLRQLRESDTHGYQIEHTQEEVSSALRAAAVLVMNEFPKR